MWPGTHKWVIQQGWLRRFFEEIIKASADIEIVPLSHVVDTHSANRLIYLPTAAYQEMMEWSLFAEQGRIYEDLVKQAKKNNVWETQRAFLRGGMWDNFFAKYPESNLMHKKMLKISSLVRKYGEPGNSLRHLLMAQCNCAYWHGLFGGIYIASLRHAIYENLLRAETIIDEDRFADALWDLEICDYDLDGKEEVLISGKKLNCCIAPHAGASVFALEYKPAAYNFSNILMRHPEIYHKDILETPGNMDSQKSSEPLSIHDIPHVSTEEYKELLVYDEYPKNSFLTHYLDSEPSIDSLLKENRVNTSQYTLTPFDLIDSMESQDNLRLSFSGMKDSVQIEKTYLYNPQGTIRLSHRIDANPDDSWIAIEWNIMILSENKPTIEGKTIQEGRGKYHSKKIELSDFDKKVNLVIESEIPWDIYSAPIECVSQRENGFEKTFQGWSIYFVRRIESYIPDVVLRIDEICQN
jgi:hypothetical protein